MKLFLRISAFAVLAMSVSLQALAQYYFDSVSFETPDSRIIMDTANPAGIWQTGTPQKVFFHSAYRGAKAMVTDTIQAYPSNNTSSFIYVIRFPYTWTCETSMEFWHKYDMDSPNDKGLIEASYDGGNSWFIAKDTSGVGPMYSFFWWDMDFHETTGGYSAHPLTTTGTSDGWILSRFNWIWFMPVKGADSMAFPPDSLMIRFTFVSDSIDSGREGWMIDEILTASAYNQLCSGISEQNRGARIKVFPNPTRDGASIEFEGASGESTIQLFNMMGRKVKEFTDTGGTSLSLSRDGLPAGLYYLVVLRHGQRQISAKVIFE